MGSYSYSHPEVLVDIAWAKSHLGQPNIKFVEVDVDNASYESGHIPGAVAFNRRTQLQNQVSRDIIGREAFEKLLGGAGIGNDDTVVLYGDNNNWFAAYGFWLFKLYGHQKVQLLNGGRVKWLNEPSMLSVVCTTNSARCSRKCCKPPPNATAIWSMSATWTNLRARSSPRLICRKPRNAPATFPTPRASHGARRSARMARSNRRTN
jgi:3-mercaptopyruvate sulfurtransferase SseA